MEWTDLGQLPQLANTIPAKEGLKQTYIPCLLLTITLANTIPAKEGLKPIPVGDDGKVTRLANTIPAKEGLKLITSAIL